MIEVQNLTKIYGKKANTFTALDGVTFSVPGGSTAAIIGKSGSGKSTLMHIMSGLDHPTRGSVTIEKRHLQTLSQKEIDKFRARDMSFIFQAFFVEPNQTCYQNVMVPLEIAKVPRRKRRAMVMEALEKVELADKAASRARDLSGGQKQRLAIARAVVNQPKLIFADEPTGNLDSITGDKIIELLFSLNETLGSTLVIVTHDTDLARRCQMQIIIKDGKVERIHEGTLSVPAARAAAGERPRPAPIPPRKPLPPTPHKPLKPLKPVPAAPQTAARPAPAASARPAPSARTIGGASNKKGTRLVS